MNFLRIAWRDIVSILKNRFIRVSVIAIIVVPLLYSLLYLAAFWDPYSKLKSVPVAVVNLDKGSTKDGKDVNYGSDIVDRLKKNDELGWKFTSKGDADSGTKGEKYYAEFIIPEDFSENILSAKNGTPKQAKILYTDNEKRNFIASQVNGKVELMFKDDIVKNIADEYTKVTFDNLYDVKDGFKAAADGSKKIKDGLSDAKKGSDDLTNGIGQVKDKMPEIQDGTQKLYDGSKQMVNGIYNTAVDSNGNPLGLRNGAYEVSNGLNQAATAVGTAQGQVSNAVSGLSNQKSLIQLINIQNAKAMRNIMGDAGTLSKVDLSSLNNLAPMLTPTNLASTNKLIQDVNGLNINGILSMPQLLQLMTPENIQNMNKLLTDTNELSQIDTTKLKPMLDLMGYSNELSQLLSTATKLSNMDMTPIKSISPLLNTKNAAVLNGLLKGAQDNFGGAQGSATLQFIQQQQTASAAYVQKADEFGKEYSEVSAKVNDPSVPADEKIKELNTLLGQYYALTTFTDTTMKSSAGTMKQMSDTLGSMNTLINANSKLISGTQSALTASNINSINAMLVNLEKAQEQISSSETQNAIKAVNSAMTSENVSYIQSTLQKLLSMKSDLDNNSESLKTVGTLLTALNADKDSLAKIAALQSDLKASAPMISTISTAMSDPSIQAQIANAPQLLGQVTKVQKELKDNQELLNIAQDALNDGNVQRAQNLISNIPTVSGQFNQLASGLNQLNNGAKALAGGIDTLGNGANKVAAGLNTLNSGMPTLKDGANKLYDGSTQLNDGLGKLYDGSDELSTKLKDGSDKINKNLVNSSSTMGKFVSDPVSVKNTPFGEVKNYGTGFTPYFIPLSLWVGALMMFFVITDKVDDDLDASPASVVAGKFLSYGYIGIFQAVLVSAVVLTLGLHPKNLLLYFLFNIFMSYVFIAIIQCLVFLLGQAGRLLSIALLIVQLTSCAGTFPLEVVPKFFKVMNPFMPFTYCTSALRELIAGIDYSVLTKDTVILAATMFVFLGVSMVFKGHADRMQEIIHEKKESIGM
ncbi:YhgE/Pip domain-containing protein [Clostridium hydrogenum]|uniref:YhgE/Pip domain-containing protein n=1 Tax=Clostridium hydrogenum TaxID=2855764 RepID=UPI001F1671C4|nr:YhgE/Pip domain-containing protein [Clostridium hydrogenum]